MIYCQACLTANPIDAEFCIKCGNRLLVIGGNQHWEENELSRVSMDDHFLERISNLEETVSSVLDQMSRMVETLDILERNWFVTKSGLTALVETLNETHLLREELLHQRWESVMTEQMEEARVRDRFAQMRNRFLALYRGEEVKRAGFRALIDDAEFQLFSDRIQECTATLKKALQLDQNNYELAYYLAELKHEQGLNKEAMVLLEQALQANPDHADSLLMLALLSYSEQDVDKSKNLLTRCIALNKRDDLAMLCLASILISEEQYDRAEDLLQQVNKIKPQAQSYYLLGLAAKETGRIKEAVTRLELALELDPDHEEAVFTLGMIYLSRKWTRKAKNCFSRALELNPNKLEYQEAYHFDEPRASGLAEMDAESQEVLSFAAALFREGKYKQALPHYRQLLKKHPSNYILLSTYAVLNFSLRRYEEALKVADRITGSEVPDMVSCVAFNIQMESLRSLGRYDEAVEVLSGMAEYFHDGMGHVIACYGLAMTKADLGQDLNEAEILAKEALEQSPPEFKHNVLDALGWVYFKQGRYEEALELLEAALNMEEDLNHLYHYGMTLLALNLQDQAFKVFERTVKLRGQNAKIDDFVFAAIRREMSRIGIARIEDDEN